MAECDRLETCLFFNDRLGDMSSAPFLLKQLYCHGDFEHCARYRVDVKLGSTSVPNDLLPEDSFTADKIVAGT
jgi:hypothetical protein